MRIFYSAIILLSSLVYMANAQQREDYDPMQGQPDVKAIQIFPNPATEFVHLRFEKIRAQNVSVTVHNIIGNEVKTETEILSEYELRVRVKELDAGYYLLAVKDDAKNSRGIYKILKR
jgi:hypothetical protein